MDSRYLKSLITVIERGSIADAARAESLTAAAISQRIRVLERQFGFDLLSRVGHAAKPTEACVSILPRARRIVREFALLAGDSDPAGLSGTLRIGAISTALTGMLPAALRALARDTPAVRPAIVPGTSQSLYNAMLADQLDVAVLVAPPFALPKTLQATLVRSEPLVFLSKKKPRTDVVGMLGERPYLRYDPQSWGGRHAEQYLMDQGCVPVPMCDLDALEAIAMLVADDVGVSLVPHWPGLERMAKNCRLTEIADARYQREVVVLSKVEPDRPAMVRALVQALTADAAP